jgi:hypothetical protein
MIFVFSVFLHIVEYQIMENRPSEHLCQGSQNNKSRALEPLMKALKTEVSDEINSLENGVGIWSRC